MKIGLIVTTHNRIDYLRKCLSSLSRAEFPAGTTIMFMDDASEPETVGLLKRFSIEGVKCLLCTKSERQGIKHSLLIGIPDLIHAFHSELIINLDGDSIVRNDFIEKLVEMHRRFPDHLITGFDCTNKKEDGTWRHERYGETVDYYMRRTVGGINLCFTPKMYQDWIYPALLEPVGNWDQKACLNAGNGVICLTPSVIQHIGLESSMGHSGEGREMADISDTFSPLHLPMVTLIGVDSNYPRLEKAIEESCKDILFGDVQAINIAQINSKQAYSDYCIKHLYKHVQTTHMLVIQWDGYVKNWKAWDPAWLQYDYIGAPWEWYTDGMQVGNGGFSLRSRRLMEIVANDPVFHKNNHPEDHVICRVHRKYLENKYDIKFAPVEVARKFSIEGYNHWNQQHTTEFGFHGPRVLENMGADKTPGIGKIIFMEQYFGIGDVIFSMQIARNLQKQGYRVLWPVMPDMVEQCQRAYPDIFFCDVNLFKPQDMGNKVDRTVGTTRMLPLRWTYELLKVGMDKCMTSKYDFMHMNWETWNQAMYTRDHEKEQQLFDELGLKDGETYTLTNVQFGTGASRSITIPITVEDKSVKMEVRPGYSLFDWSKVIEYATEIHTVSTSIVYILELLEIQAISVYIYLRAPIERNHDNYKHLMVRHSNKYIFV